MIKKSSFKEISKNYKVIFFDSFGVLKNSKGIIDGVYKTFNSLIARGTEYFILTNDASRSPKNLAFSYQKSGFMDIVPDKMISSGMLAMEYLRDKIKSGKVAFIGTEASAWYIENVGLTAVSIKFLHNKEHWEDIKALVLLDDEGFDWQYDLNNTLNLLRNKNIPVIMANTDLTYPVDKGNVAIGIGSIGNMIEQALGRNFMRFGKPDAQIFNYAYQHICKHDNFSKSEILMVGDTLQTDIIGANKFGIDTALVLTGNTSNGQVLYQIETTGIVPDFICDSVAS